MAELLAALLVVETVLFVLTMALANRDKTRVAGEYVGTGFHLLLLPVIAALPIGMVGQGAGLAWVVCDIVASTGLIWTARGQAEVGTALFTPVRMAGHLFAAVWVALVSATLGTLELVVALALALGFAVYTLAAGRLPQKALALPGVLMVAWLLMAAAHFHAAQAS